MTPVRYIQTNEDYQSAFDYFDVNKDGHITVHELETAMNKCGVYPTKLELRIIMNQMDKDKNGLITFDEFSSMMRLQRKEQNSQRIQSQKRLINLSNEQPEIKKELLDQFRLFDKDNDGFILPEEMKNLINELRLGKNFPEKVVDQLFLEADTDGDGKISFEEFVIAVI
ncbi:hypothetical protein Mgra_00000574 [Meloidogyne graminicola]|uniref:EF-hand domain-containing protein n=1 Tax=Meloidogyne graminicola TaxID=189291 RepID=A0A8T0A2R1_9BILA|nr:hypothetical protein Mgra_00000574 [Meloidogyne graminicola]